MVKKAGTAEDVERSKKHKKEVTIGISPAEVAERDTKNRKNQTRIDKLKEEIKALQKENEKLRREAETETETREMYVINEFHFSTKKVLVRRADTDEVVEERTMTAEELQEFIPSAGVERGKGKADDEDNGPN